MDSDVDNDIKQAIALKYDGKKAPTISAKGEHEIADAIIAMAIEHKIPLYENPELIELLAHLELGDEIPKTLYIVIAQIIAFAYYIQGKVPEGFNPDDWPDYVPIDLLHLND